MNIYLCGITQNQLDPLKELIEPIYEYFDGLIWVDGISFDGTFEYLNSHKKNGKIIQYPYMRRNDFQMNHYLFSGIMKEGDWFVMRDSCEKLGEAFCKNDLKHFIEVLETNFIDCVYHGSKPFLTRYSERLYFHGNPHWGLHGVVRPIKIENCNLTQKAEEISWCNRPKWRGNMELYIIWGEFNYYINYPNSNQCWMIYNKNKEKWMQQEQVRLDFIKYCTENYIPFLLKNEFIEYLQQASSFEGEDHFGRLKPLLDIMKKEDMLWNIYRYYVLGDKPEIIRSETMEKRKEFGYNG